MANVPLPATADMISYLEIVNTLAAQLKGTLAPADYNKFVTTHNAISTAVVDGAAVADLTPYIMTNINIPVSAAAPATNTNAQ